MPYKNSRQVLVSLLLLISVSACQALADRNNSNLVASWPAQLNANCLNSIAAFREAVDAEKVGNASAPVMRSLPLLHGNRFLTHLATAAESSAKIQEWTLIAAELAASTRASENRNLHTPWSKPDMKRLSDCATAFATEPQYAEQRAILVSRVQKLPDSYNRSRQYLGALVLLKPFLERRILAGHKDEKAWFAEEENFRQSNFYQVEALAEKVSDAEIAAWMQQAYLHNELKLPSLEDTQLDALVLKHAPKLEIEFDNDNDRIGTPEWQSDQIIVNTNAPVLYTQNSMTQFAGRNLLQLNYIFWFSERRPRAWMDLYSGKIDSIIWRVTLDESGEVLLYDSIHSCGCYHKYFQVSEKLQIKTEPLSGEPANIFELDDLNEDDSVVLKITSNDHYVVGVDGYGDSKHRKVNENGQISWTYSLAPYASLNNISSDNGSKSLFDSQGLITGSERLERFTLWPTGILSVGAMRQWGTHATGFIQQQHFDDAELFNNYFELRP